MTDVSKTIAPKSDQLNSDDLLATNRTIKITKVSLLSDADQPIAINFEGDNGKPYKPCKGMRRVLVNVWGRDGNQYIGRSMTIYRDDKVMFGGVNVGGIRISHMSHIDKEVTMALTASRTSRKPFTVKPLATLIPSPPMALDVAISDEAQDAAERGTTVLKAFWDRLNKAQQQSLLPRMDELKTTAAKADVPVVDPFGFTEEAEPI